MEKKAPAGAHLDTPSLESTCFMYLRHKNTDSMFIKYRTCIFAGKKAPAGAHPVAPKLDNTESVYVIHRNFCFRHRQCVCICNIEVVSLINIICIFETYNLYLCGIYYLYLHYTFHCSQYIQRPKI